MSLVSSFFWEHSVFTVQIQLVIHNVQLQLHQAQQLNQSSGSAKNNMKLFSNLQTTPRDITNYSHTVVNMRFTLQLHNQSNSQSEMFTRNRNINTVTVTENTLVGTENKCCWTMHRQQYK